MFLFPYKQIVQDSNIIIYGVGNIGFDYIEQINENKYANLIAVMDSNYQGMKLLFDTICEEEDIGKYINVLDYVIIAILDESEQMKIAFRLIQRGINKEKIIFANGMEVGKNRRSIYRKKDLFDRQCLQYMMDDFFIYANGDIEYFIFIILELKVSFEKSIRLAECFQLINMDICNEWKIIIIRLYIQAGYMNATLLKKYIEIVCKINDLDERYMLISDIAILPVYFRESLYHEFYADLSNAYKNVVEEYRLSVSEVKKNKQKKIAILLNYLGAEFEHGDFKKNVINGLRKAGFYVNVFCLDIRRWYAGACFIKPFDRMGCEVSPSRYFHNIHIRECEGVQFTYINENCIKDRMQKSIDEVVKYNPDMIIDFTDEIAPQSYILNKLYSIIYWPMRGIVSSMFHSKMITSSNIAADYYRKNFKCERNVKMLICNMNIQIETKKRNHSRLEYGLDEMDFIIVTVGARLEYEMSIEFMDSICELLKQNSRMRWLIVGSEKIDYIKVCHNEMLINKKIQFIKYETDLIGLYEICDVYLNPKRTGGAISRLYASAKSLPVVADASIFFDLKELIAEEDLCYGIEEQMNMIFKMMQSAQMKNEMKKRASKSYVMWENQTKGNNIIEIINAEYMMLGEC